MFEMPTKNAAFFSVASCKKIHHFDGYLKQIFDPDLIRPFLFCLSFIEMTIGFNKHFFCANKKIGKVQWTLETTRKAYNK